MDEIENEVRQQEQDAIQRELDERVHTHPTGCPDDCDCQEGESNDDW